jgi:acyl carrier protein
MELEEKKQLLADLFEVEIEEIQENVILEDFEPWDSMSKLSLIVLMDDECGKKLSGEQILEFKTIGDIIDFMEN